MLNLICRLSFGKEKYFYMGREFLFYRSKEIVTLHYLFTELLYFIFAGEFGGMINLPEDSRISKILRRMQREEDPEKFLNIINTIQVSKLSMYFCIYYDYFLFIYYSFSFS